MSSRWPAGSTPAWRRVRLLVLQRDGWRCRLGLAGCTGRATQVHHTVAREVAGDDPRYLLAACSSCNLKVGDPGRYDPPPLPWTDW